MQSYVKNMEETESPKMIPRQAPNKDIWVMQVFVFIKDNWQLTKMPVHTTEKQSIMRNWILAYI